MWRLTRYGLAFAAGQAFQVAVDSYRAHRELRESIRLSNEAWGQVLNAAAERWRRAFE